MKTLDRYVLREFVRNLVFSLGVFVALVLVVDLWEKIDTYIDHGSPALTVLRYYGYQIPYTVSITLPMAMLLASLFTVGQLARRNELVAMRASGVAVRRTLAPLLLLAAAISLFALLFDEHVVPRANEEMRRIEDYDIKKKPRRSGAIRHNVHVLGAEGRIFLVKSYDADNREMADVVVQRFARNRLAERLDAQKARWGGDGWVFQNGFVRTFSDTGETAAPFAELPRHDIREAPEEFATEEKDPEAMNFRELGGYIEKVRAGGSEVGKLEVERQLKVAFPFANFIVVLLGGSLSAVRRKSGLAFGFGVSLALCFVYYGIMRVSEALGGGSSLPAPAAAWTANAVFLVAGVWLLVRAER
jgi:lipopolysaccharide export system permease protein